MHDEDIALLAPSNAAAGTPRGGGGLDVRN